MRARFVSSLLLALVIAVPAVAQPTDGPATEVNPNEGKPLFGFEFEFAGVGNRVVHFEEMPFENYEKLMRVVVEHYGGDPSTIERVDFTKATSNLERFPSGERELFRAEWKDSRGRKWLIEPEFVASSGFDGYELVTPPMDDPRELREILERVKASGIVREGNKSGVHVTIDGERLVTGRRGGGNADALVNLVMLHENYEPMLRRLLNPVRGGGHANRFARSLAIDHPDLLRELDALPRGERSLNKVSRMFRAREAREAELFEADPMDPTTWTKLWKYRSMNLAKILDVNDMHDADTRVVEFRMNDLAAPSRRSTTASRLSASTPLSCRCC